MSRVAATQVTLGDEVDVLVGKPAAGELIVLAQRDEHRPLCPAQRAQPGLQRADEPSYSAGG